MKQKNRKISKIRILRILSQILFFILLPGLYISAFSGVKQIYQSIYQGNFNFLELLPQIIAFLVVIPVTMLAGRFFCGWMCAFGSLGDFIYGLSKQVNKHRKPMPENIDRVLKYLKYVFLLVLIIFGWSLGVDTFQNANPWDAFGMLFTVGAVPAVSYVISNLGPALLILIAIMVGSFYVERFFCRYLCPLGAIFELTSKLRITAIEKPSEKCGNCRVCTKNCPMGIQLYKKDTVKSGECINCLQCITKCPRNNIGLTVVEQDVRPILFSTLAISAITGAYYVGSFATTGNVYASTKTTTTSASDQLYTDGTYEGSGTGFRGRTTTVSVSVKNGVISDISLVSTGDDRPFINRAFNTVVSSIIEEQDTNVDAVSGATYSSNGIMEAVANALQQASTNSDSNTNSYVDNTVQDTSGSADTSSDNTLNSSTEETAQSFSEDNGDDASQNTNNSSDTNSNNSQQDSSGSTEDNSDASNTWVITPNTTTDITSDTSSQTNTQDSTKNSTQTDTQSTDSSASTDTVQGYKDGTYEGSGTGFRGGTTKVSVTVEKGLITDISVISTRDDRPFFNRAYSYVAQAIIDEQSANVDAVSGATYSSNGIMEAVADALSNA
ncbi:MAG TPA: FMN-binding protein [Mobilitalea sp.]|nr:FMN-binding protein [Mobilitalea sp.]